MAQRDLERLSARGREVEVAQPVVRFFPGLDALPANVALPVHVEIVVNRWHPFAQMFYFVFHDTDFGRGSDGISVNFKPSAAIGGWQPVDLDNAVHSYFLVRVGHRGPHR